jgi:hypothetical protein
MGGPERGTSRAAGKESSMQAASLSPEKLYSCGPQGYGACRHGCSKRRHMNAVEDSSDLHSRHICREHRRGLRDGACMYRGNWGTGEGLLLSL